MNNLINSILNWIKSHKVRVTLIGVVVAFVLLVVLWVAGVNVIGHVDNWLDSRRRQAAHEEIQKAKDEAAQSKQIAAEALSALEQEKKVTAAETKKRELAESLLADRSLTANEKLRLYEQTVNAMPTHTEPTTDVNALCARAAALGVSCE